MPPVRTAARGSGPTVRAALVVVGAAFVGVLALQSLASSSAPESRASSSATIAPPADAARGERPADRGEAAGSVPDGVTVFDDGIPGVAKLEPELLDALRRAATDAADDGVEFVVNSGWRSRAYQERLRREAVAEYGSEAEAARWVASPDTSAHVSGDAIDLGPAAAAWLSEHGSGYGLCQIYDNESWHFELRPEAVGGSCPPMYADAAHDPRLQP